ncbi:hypothetical protein EC988_009118, partial [Linderina pennispora]
MSDITDTGKRRDEDDERPASVYGEFTFRMPSQVLGANGYSSGSDDYANQPWETSTVADEGSRHEHNERFGGLQHQHIHGGNHYYYYHQHHHHHYYSGQHTPKRPGPPPAESSLGDDPLTWHKNNHGSIRVSNGPTWLMPEWSVPEPEM